ncbi:PH domain-containing protein, partial [Candidatus Micrarchaeota archaeon]|nr:PH domain-containing protein [Candidatus Micrarchaeota archaeon]
VYQTGIFSSKRKIISLDSIVDTSLERGLLDGVFNVAKLNVSTAGSRSFDASISNVNYGSANELHERIHEKIRRRERKFQSRLT